MSEPNSLVRTERLTKIYGQQVEIRALDHVNLTIREGEMIAVMGPSGSGKSTLLNLLGALDRPTSGTVYIDGQDLSKIRNVDRFRAKTVGFVFQMHNLIPTLTAIENVGIPLRGQGLSARRRRERTQECLEMVGLSDRADHLPSQLSGGQRQRVAVARSVVNEPRLILADELTGNLDSTSGNDIKALLTRLNRDQGTTILIVTHDRQVARIAERILTMRDGMVVEEHRVGDPISEDLWDLAHSELGRRLVARDIEGLASSPLVADAEFTRVAQGLCDLLDGVRQDAQDD